MGSTNSSTSSGNGTALIPGKAANVCLTLRDPAGVGVPLAQRFPIRVRGDDTTEVGRLREWLQQAGFRPEVGEPLAEAEALAAAITLAPGPFGASRAPAQVRQLTELLRDLIDDATIDSSRYPLRVLPDSEGPFAEILSMTRSRLGSTAVTPSMSYLAFWPTSFAYPLTPPSTT